MEKIKKILELSEAGWSKTAITESCGVSRQAARVKASDVVNLDDKGVHEL